MIENNTAGNLTAPAERAFLPGSVRRLSSRLLDALRAIPRLPNKPVLYGEQKGGWGRYYILRFLQRAGKGRRRKPCSIYLGTLRGEAVALIRRAIRDYWPEILNTEYEHRRTRRIKRLKMWRRAATKLGSALAKESGFRFRARALLRRNRCHQLKK
ncbi:MAG: hypothetical protein JXR37_06365 [Kiritimatiellae bacterium]|nr:hypothetical protein [Kiritimatiellia bacterium]